MRVPKVVVVASGCLVSLWVVERAFLILDGVSWGGGRERGVALVRAVEVVLLGQLPGQRVVMRKSRRVYWMVLRRSVLKDKSLC